MPSAGVARLYVLCAALLFSTGGAAIKLCALSSWQIAGFRSGLAAVLLWLLMPAWRTWWRPRALVVALAYAATLILYVTANTLTTAANSIFLQASAPLYLLVLGPRLLGEPNTRRDLAVVALVGVGLVLFFVGREAPLRTAPDPLRGNLLAAASGLTWALTLLGLRWLGRARRSPHEDPTGAAVVAGNALAFLLCLPLALPVVEAGASDWLIVGWLGLFQIGLAYVALVRGVRSLRAIEVSLLLVLEPIANAGFAWWIHAERPGPWSLAGCGLVLIGTLVQALRQPARADRAAGSAAAPEPRPR
jgi:drug/metabolite transporter (DMT)-like permease